MEPVQRLGSEEFSVEVSQTRRVGRVKVDVIDPKNRHANSLLFMGYAVGSSRSRVLRTIVPVSASPIVA
jgi:hypothetical protein